VGQRELIIGDRQTGKTPSHDIDTILNQKGEDVVLRLRGDRSEISLGANWWTCCVSGGGSITPWWCRAPRTCRYFNISGPLHGAAIA